MLAGLAAMVVVMSAVFRVSPAAAIVPVLVRADIVVHRFTHAVWAPLAIPAALVK